MLKGNRFKHLIKVASYTAKLINSDFNFLLQQTYQIQTITPSTEELINTHFYLYYFNSKTKTTKFTEFYLGPTPLVKTNKYTFLPLLL